MPLAPMHPDVTLAVAGKFHAFSLASEYAARGRLNALYCSHRQLSPPRNVRRATYKNRVDLAVLSHLVRFGLPFSDYNRVEWFQRWLVPKLRHF